MPRNQHDLIEELDREAAAHTAAMLAVGFENTTLFVVSYDPDRLHRLADAIEHGGEPIGLVAYDLIDRDGGQELTVKARLLSEYVGAGWAEDYLKTLLDNFHSRAAGLAAGAE